MQARALPWVSASERPHRIERVPWASWMEGAKEHKWRADHVQPREQDRADELLRAVHATSRSSQNWLLPDGACQPGKACEEVAQAVARHPGAPGQVLIGDGVRAYGDDDYPKAVVLPELAGIGPFGAHQVGSMLREVTIEVDTLLPM